MSKRANFRFTPGPWTARALEDEYGCYIIEEAAKEQESARGARKILLANHHDENNAHLIGAAPDLLRVCELLVNKVGVSHRTDLTAWKLLTATEIGEILNGARRAIKKAHKEL